MSSEAINNTNTTGFDFHYGNESEQYTFLKVDVYKRQGYDNGDDLRQGGSKSGHIIKGPDWLTMFNGETGAAMPVSYTHLSAVLSTKYRYIELLSSSSTAD